MPVLYNTESGLPPLITYGTLTKTDGTTYNVTLNNGAFALVLSNITASASVLVIETSSGIVSVTASNIKGVTFVTDGSDPSLTQLPEKFLSNCTGFNTDLIFPDSLTKINAGMLTACTSFNSEVKLPNSITQIGDNFLYGCTAYNKILKLPTSLTAIGSYFMSGCTAFVHLLKLPDTLQTIGAGFMFNCNSIAGVNIGSIAQTKFSTSEETLSTATATAVMYTTGVNVYGDYSGQFCTRFPNRDVTPYRNLTGQPPIPPDPIPPSCTLTHTNNTVYRINLSNKSFADALCTVRSSLTFPLEAGELTILKPNIKGITFITDDSDDTLVTIGDFFLFQAVGFTSELELPEGVVTINNGFMHGCITFNAEILLPTTLKTIGANFLTNCLAFNTELVLPNALLTIGRYFLSDCIAYNQDLAIPSTVTNIGDSFLAFCESFDKPITLPTGVVTIAANFLSNCSAFNSAISFGTLLNKIGDYFLDECDAYDQELTLPASLRTIGRHFLNNCDIYNKLLVLPNLTTIDDSFLQGCKAYNQITSLPASLTSIGSHFLYNCDSLTSRIDISTLAVTKFKESDYTVSTSTETAPIYVLGIQVTGTNREQFMARFPNRTTLPYRKFVNLFGTIIHTDGTIYEVLVNNDTFSNILCTQDTAVDIPTRVGLITFQKTEIKGITFLRDGTDNSLTAIGSYFLADAENYSYPLLMPTSVTAIGEHFMSGCTGFNGYINFSTSLQTIGDYYLNGCTAYNQSFALPSSLKVIGAYFLNECTAFNQDIGAELANMTSIGEGFMHDCESMVGTVIIGTLTVTKFAASDDTLSCTDDTAAMYTTGVTITGTNVNAFKTRFPNRIETPFRHLLPDAATYGTLTTIDNTTYAVICNNNAFAALLTGNVDTTSITIPTIMADVVIDKEDVKGITFKTDDTDVSLTAIGNSFMSKYEAYNSPLVLPNSLKTIGNSFLDTCEAFDSIVTLSTALTAIGTNFLLNCSAYNQTINLPSTLKTIGTYFFGNCTSYNKPLNMPTSLTGVGAGFLNNCDDMEDKVSLNTLAATVFATSDYTLSTGTETADMFVTGVTIEGTNTAAFKTRFPNRPTTPFRHLLPDPTTYGSITTTSNVTYITTANNSAFATILSGTSSGTKTIPTIMGNVSIAKADVKGMTFQTDGTDTTLTALNNYFLYSYPNLNMPVVLPPSLTSIGTNFIADCATFNSTITIPNTVKTIGDDFLVSCIVFDQTVALPTAIESIGQSFLQNCTLFSKALALPTGLKTIGKLFLNLCANFNEDISIPDTVTSVGVDFMYICKEMTSDVNINGLAVTVFATSNNTLSGTNTSPQYLIGPTIKGTNYAAFQGRFPNRSVTPFRHLRPDPTYGTLTKVDGTVYDVTVNNAGFANILCTNQTSITIPTNDGDKVVLKSSIKGITFHTDGTDTSLTDIGDQFLLNATNFENDLVLPSSLTTIGDEFLSLCTNYNKPLNIPEGVTSIGDQFLFSCAGLNQPISLPITLTTIGDQFLSNCLHFNQDISLPSAITSIGDYFLYNCTDMSLNLDIGSLSPSVFDDTDTEHTLSTTNELAAMYVMGITIQGTNIADFLDKFPNSYTSPYRRLYNENELGSLIKTDDTVYRTTADNETFAGVLCNQDTSITMFTNSGNVTVQKTDIKGVTFVTDGTDTSLTALDDNFLYGSTSFNTPLILPDSLTEIGDNFLQGCTSFDSSITLPDTITEIGNNFLYGNIVFDTSLVLPSGLVTIGQNFLYGCTIFDKVLELPDTLETIGSHFLETCEAFNQPVSLPDSLTSVAEYFMYNCDAMTDIIDINELAVSIFATSNYTLSTTTETADFYMTGAWINGTNFKAFQARFSNRTETPFRHTRPEPVHGSLTKLDGTVYETIDIHSAFATSLSTQNSSITIKINGGTVTVDKTSIKGIEFYSDTADEDSTFTKIPDNFLYGATNLAMDLVIPATVTEIGNAFLYNCISFNHYMGIRSSGITKIGNYFMHSCKALNYFPIPSGCTEVGDHCMDTCEAFNSSVFLSALTSIGSYFMANCITFNSSLTLNDAGEIITSIGSYFLSGCKAYAPNPETAVLRLPTTLTSVGAGFMYNCDSFMCDVNIQDLPATVFASSNDTFATTTNTAPIYVTGPLVVSSDNDKVIEFKNKFQDKVSTSPYRRLRPKSLYGSVTKIDDTVIYTTDMNQAFMEALSNNSGSVSIITKKPDESPETVVIQKSDIKLVRLSSQGEGFTSIPGNFLRDCVNLLKIENAQFGTVAAVNIYPVGGYFCAGCTSFNMTLCFGSYGNELTIGGHFLEGCTSFDSPVYFGKMGGADIMMYRCDSMKSNIYFGPTDGGVYWPTWAASDHSFGCSDMNKDIFKVGPTFAVLHHFMYNQGWINILRRFDVRYTGPYRRIKPYPPVNSVTITSVTYYSTENCAAFCGRLCTTNPTDPNVTIMTSSGVVTIAKSDIRRVTFRYDIANMGNDASLTHINDNFLANSGVADIGTMPSSVQSIGNNFMLNCSNYEGAMPIIRTEVITSIGNNFMRGCSKYNSPFWMPRLVKTIGDYFLAGCTSFNSTMSLHEHYDYVITDTIGDHFMDGCTAFEGSTDTSYLDLNKFVATIGSHFLANCSLYKSNIFNGDRFNITPLTSIGSHFLAGCTSFNNNIRLPTTVTSIGKGFMNSCDAMTSTINFRTRAIMMGIEADGDELGDKSFVTTNSEAPMFVTAPYVTGADGQAAHFVLIQFPYNNQVYYRRIRSAYSVNYTYLIKTDNVCFRIESTGHLMSAMLRGGTEFTYGPYTFNTSGDGSQTIQDIEIKHLLFSGNERYAHMPNNFGTYLNNLKPLPQKPFKLPSAVLTIGDNFLSNVNYNFDIDLEPPPISGQPALSSIGRYFMTNCQAMTGMLNLGTVTADKFNNTTDISVLSVNNATYPAYVSGINIVGNDQLVFRQRFYNLNGESSRYRKLNHIGPASDSRQVLTTGGQRYYITSNNQALAIALAGSLDGDTYVNLATTEGAVSILMSQIKDVLFNKDSGVDTSLGTIPNNFLANATNFEPNNFRLPDGVQNIGSYYLYNCRKFACDIFIPSSILSINAEGFGFELRSFGRGGPGGWTLVIDIPNIVSKFSGASDTLLSTLSNTAILYTGGVSVQAPGQSPNFCSVYYNLSGPYYRWLRA